jgi:hypothetical protein
LSFGRNRTFAAAWLTPLLVVLAALALPAGAAAAGTGNIAGTVTGEGSGALTDVEVCAEEVTEENFECAKTEGTGEYEVTGLEEGQYKVIFIPGESTNFLTQWYEDKLTWETATPVSVVGGTTKSGVNATLEKGAKINGRVTVAASGQAAPEVVVCAFSTANPEDGRCTETGISGNYTIVGLRGGQYRVSFHPEGHGQGLAAQEYSLGLVTVAAKGEANGINQALQAGGQITGVVRLAATGAPLAGVRVCLTEAGVLESLGCLTTPASGAYRFFGLWSGNFKIAFSAGPSEFPDKAPVVDAYPTQWWNGASTFETATPIAITPPAIVGNVNAALGPPAAVPVTPAPVVPVAPKKKVVKKPLKCHKGFTKRKVHGKARCVRRANPAKHKPHPKKSA